MSFIKSLFFLIFFLISFSSYGRERVYNLVVENKTVNFTGKEIKHALAINGSIPAPTLRFEKGDRAIINVTNKTNEPTTIHWHGVLVPWDMDGPAFSNNKLIQTNETFTFRFPIKHTGTYWYHSHTKLQEQRGLYGSIVIKDSTPRFYFDHDIVAVVSDWTNEKPEQVLANLKKEGEYYSYKKRFFPSLVDAIFKSSLKDFLKAEWTGMGFMDLSDIGYDAFLINGKQKSVYSKIRAGDKVRLRVINAGSSSHFYLNLGKHQFFKVISKDGVDVRPVKVNEVFIGMGETYDLSFTVPKTNGGLEFRATASDMTGYGSLIFGNNHHYESVPDFIKPNPYKMNHEMDHKSKKHKIEKNKSSVHRKGHRMSNSKFMNHGKSNNHKMDANHKMQKNKSINSKRHENHIKKKQLNYKMLKAVKKTNYSSKYPRHHVHLKLNGSMGRYTWSLNGKTFSEEKYIIVREGEVVQIHFKNETMMTHPMHLHGHFFRVLNGQGDYSPLFHTVDVKPFEEVVIEAHMNEPGVWMFHCHNLYHMKMGMARLIKYDKFKRPEDLIKHEKEFFRDFKTDRSLFLKTEILLFTNYSELVVGAKKGNYDFKFKMEMEEYKFDTLEIKSIFSKNLKTIPFTIIGGAIYEHENLHGLFGISHTLPLLIDLEFLIKTNKEIKIEIEKEIPIWSRLNLEMEYEFEMELGDKEKKHKFKTLLDYQIHDRLKFGTYYKTKHKKNDSLEHSIGIGLRSLF